MQRSQPNTAPVEPVASHHPKPRRRKPARAEIGNDLLEHPRWLGLRQQQRLQSRNHTAAENDAARRRCLEFLQGGTAAMASAGTVASRRDQQRSD